MLFFARDSDLIAGGASGIDAALIFLFQGAAKGVGALVLYELSEVLDFLIGSVLGDTEIKLDGFAANAAASAHGHAGISLGRSFVLCESGEAETQKKR